MNSPLPGGTTVRQIMTRCACLPELLTTSSVLAPLLREAASACGLEPLEWVGHDFGEGGGHTTCVLLAESHVTVHTYPETAQTAIAEISICDYQKDNRQLARALAGLLEEIFEPAEKVLKEERW